MTGTLCIGGWMRPRAGLDGCGISPHPHPPPEFDPRTVQPVAFGEKKSVSFFWD